MLVARLEALTLYMVSPQFQIGTRIITPMCQKPENFFSKPLNRLGFIKA